MLQPCRRRGSVHRLIGGSPVHLSCILSHGFGHRSVGRLCHRGCLHCGGLVGGSRCSRFHLFLCCGLLGCKGCLGESHGGAIGLWRRHKRLLLMLMVLLWRGCDSGFCRRSGMLMQLCGHSLRFKCLLGCCLIRSIRLKRLNSSLCLFKVVVRVHGCGYI